MPPTLVYADTMKFRFSTLAAALPALPMLLLSSCSWHEITDGGTPYFGTGQSTHYVPRELQEHRIVEDDDYEEEDYVEDYVGDYKGSH